LAIFAGCPFLSLFQVFSDDLKVIGTSETIAGENTPFFIGCETIFEK